MLSAIEADTGVKLAIIYTPAIFDKNAVSVVCKKGCIVNNIRRTYIAAATINL